MTVPELREEIRRITDLVAEAPASEREQRRREELDKLSKEDRALVGSVVTLEVLTHPQTMHENFWSKNWEKLLNYGFAIIFIVGFLLLILGVVLFVPHPTPAQEFVIRLILTLVAGLAGVFIPGFLHIEGKWANFGLRASGAVALAVIVYVKNPPVLIRESNAERAALVDPQNGNKPQDGSQSGN
jgi:hypothetical protein